MIRLSVKVFLEKLFYNRNRHYGFFISSISFYNSPYNYLLDGRLEISNNRAERSIKPFVIGRKNWMFSVSQAGARTSAMYYSLLISARENGLSPYEYLVYVFGQAPNLGKAGYAASFSDLLPTSDKLPLELYVLKSEKQEQKIYPWEDD